MSFHNIYRELQRGMAEDHYVFELNEDVDKLELIYKNNTTCHTRHCKTKSELFTWYADEIYKYDNNIPNQLDVRFFESYAEKMKITEDHFVRLIKETILDLRDKQPEYFL